VSIEAWQIGVGLASVGGTALGYVWNAAVQKGHREALVAALAKQREEDARKLETAETHRANQFLRVFQAIEELRRRLGNGDRTWTELTPKE
jgi:hypothetical protein